MSFVAVGVSLAAATAATKVTSGAIGKAKDKKEAALLRLTRPKASLNPDINSNLALAESELSNGDAGANQAWRESTDSALASSIGATLKGGGTPNDVASVFANSEQGRQNMLKFREQLRQQKVGNLSTAYQLAANDKDKVFDYNSRQWFDDAQANARKSERDNSLMWSGISDIGAIGTNIASQGFAGNQNDKTLADQQAMFDKQQQNFMQQMNSYFNPTPVVPINYNNGGGINSNGNDGAFSGGYYQPSGSSIEPVW